MDATPIPHAGSTARRILVGIGLLIAALGAWVWILRPDEPMRWLRGMLVVPGIWCAMMLYRRWVIGSLEAPDGAKKAAIQRYFDSAILIVVAAGCPVAVGYGLLIWSELYGSLGGDLGQRILALTAAAVFVVVGNMLPKILTPLAMLPPGRSARQQEARRFLGLTFVLAGLTIAVASVAAPLDLLQSVRRWSVLVWIVATLAAIVWMNVAPSRPEARHEQGV